MFDDLQINGGRKVPRKPNLGAYDSRRPPSRGADPAYHDAQFTTRFDKDAPRGHAAARAELVAFGVNGEVEFFRAALTAGLKVTRVQRDSRTATRERWQPANDNTKLAAQAA